MVGRPDPTPNPNFLRAMKAHANALAAQKAARNAEVARFERPPSPATMRAATAAAVAAAEKARAAGVNRQGQQNAARRTAAAAVNPTQVIPHTNTITNIHRNARGGTRRLRRQHRQRLSHRQAIPRIKLRHSM